MASSIWERDPIEAYKNPYEYGAQEQFTLEANKVINRTLEILGMRSLHFKTSEKSIQKAVWLLQTDAIAFLKDGLDALEGKKHRICSIVFRNVIESLDLASYFHCNSEESNKDLEKWYNDEIIKHEQFRKHLRKTKGKDAADSRRIYHRNVSKFTHRTYRALLDSYSVGRDDGLVFDGIEKSGMLALPQTISTYYAVLADLICFSLYELESGGLISRRDIEKIKMEKQDAGVEQ